MKIFFTLIFFAQSFVFAAINKEQACADKTQKQNEMQLITAKISQSEQLGMDTQKEMQAMALARQELAIAEDACPMTKDEACATQALKKKEESALIGQISRNPLMDMDLAMKKLKAVTEEYKKAKSICQ
ncbi:hypothetical protein CIK05_00730 [Bdellovibrio sp. qaytius]|nr:hypothetical protein CIK05_00730 [Bdellovibrio sp. qaytius]